MHILVVAPAYPSPESIAGVFVADQVAALLRDHDVTVVVPEPRGWRLVLVGALSRVLRRESAVARDAQAPGDVSVLRPTARTWIPRSARSVNRGLEQAVEAGLAEATSRRGPPDLVHVHVAYPVGYAAIRVARRHGIPAVLTEHSGPFRAIVSSAFARRAVTWTFDHADRVLAVGPMLRAEMLGLAPGHRIEILENVVDTEFFVPGEPAITPAPESSIVKLYTLGLQAPQKGVDVLLDAVSRLAAHGTACELVIGGDGPARPDLQERARRLGIAGSCRFVGAQSRQDVRDWLRWCDIYVSASRHESFGLAIAEAIACERPVVATKSGGPEAFVDPAFGVLVERDDPAALAGAISSVASGEAHLHPSVGRQRMVERFGQPAFMTRISQIYEDVLAARRSDAR